MRRLVLGFPLLLAAVAGTLFLQTPPIRSQQPSSPAEDDASSRSEPRANRGPARGGRGRGGFRPPSPPVLTALDANRDGEISTDELQNAAQALRQLDKNRDGQLADDELRPDFGRRGFPFGRGRGGGGRGRFEVNNRLVEPEDLPVNDGVAVIPDQATFQRLSYRGDEVMIDTFLAGLEFVKFTLDQPGTDQQRLYFINTQTHRAHMMFARAAGLPVGRGDEQMKGVLVYRPLLESPSGNPGLYTFEFEPFDAYSYDMVKLCQDSLIGKMPILEGNIGYYPRGERALARYTEEQALYDQADVRVYREKDLIGADVAYLPLNLGQSFGRLRLMELDERPAPRDVVLYRSLPNEMSRVAGIITTVRQTPLSHVNLRAIQDQVPNAFIRGAAAAERIRELLGKYVSYKVTPDGYELRAATAGEVERHFASLRPSEPQLPPRDLSVRTIRPLDEISFQDSLSVGVKAANLATLRTCGFPSETVPDGFAVPFYFYDQFMKHNGFYAYARQLLVKPEFQQDQETQTAELKKFRSLIKKGKLPHGMMAALDQLHKSFPAGSSLRCRSSTNNEDLPGFSGAGLYDSYTHKPDEGHLSKSIKQVYASLWNFRAFEEREFYRIDHLAAQMGVLVHPNFKGELVNGVAVTDDILYQTVGNYYLNSQVGEDLITNPKVASIPEEVLLDWWDSSDYQVMRRSNRAATEQLLLSAEQLDQLRKYLAKIHARFARLYDKTLHDRNFAMEIEFKITKQGKLAIKQARPWVYAQ